MLLQTYGFTDIVVDVNGIFISGITCTKIKDLGSRALVDKYSKPFCLLFDYFSKVIADCLLLKMLSCLF
ncbi:hypothetical protein APHMUC_0246 [Anaplasma phagocytophilum str. ApMUC09]|uniref:Uncharacterized protein n=1 Tax=Anaplasma phagocytophilum str. ApMUC09 TaxID=1359152 RepID=A0A0F3NA03_ANAPH|nr:hypothetical protein APHMUC_0261 [Anaplasma phagocytophilum str. ApMUC09]KJV64532.1 hypothetical protein APHMUC_0246 [Anaplasma phagocytophilum str. ApMUC09]SCV63836.1 hypothetical protein ANAPH2_00760 [Anaplasma phagocytophilum]